MDTSHDDETIEDMIKRYAYNRWDMRMHFRWKLEETDVDDYKHAKQIVEDELKRRNNNA